MNNDIRNKADQLPEGRKKTPFGKWLLLKLLRLNNLPVGKDRNKDLLLTTVSNCKDYSQGLSSGPNPDPDSYRECEATKADSSNTAWSIKIFLN